MRSLNRRHCIDVTGEIVAQIGDERLIELWLEAYRDVCRWWP
jgi:hypothetical protein